MKERIKAPEKIQLSNEKIANLSDAEFKTGDQDAHRTHRAQRQQRKDPGRKEGDIKWNNKKSTGNQQ